MEDKTLDTEFSPWFTGPLIATSANVIPIGHFDVEPYLFITNNFATYDNHWKSVNQIDFWTISQQLPLWIGIASWADIIIQPTLNWNQTRNQSQWVFGDFIAGIEFQIHRSVYPHKDWIPSIKVALWEKFPTGKYRNLSPHKRLTDLGGGGSYVSTFRLILGRLEHIFGDHFLNWRINIDYSLPSNVHVKGLNAYGGGFGTDGKVTPGRNFELDLGMEYNLSRHWALALDIIGNWQSKSRFCGTPGFTESGAIASNITKAYIQYSMAPGIEYNFSKNLGIIGGVWFTVAGKNADRYYSGVIALNYYW